MGNFEIAVALVLRNEGGYVDNPNDSGGATNFGISLRFLQGLPLDRLKKYGIFEPLTIETVKQLTVEQAKGIYYGEFWMAAPFDQLTNTLAACYIFDCCVNHGLAQGIRILQWSLWAVLGSITLKDDGVMGDNTLKLVAISGFQIMPALRATRGMFMRGIAQGKDKEFLDGWLRRAYS